MQESELRKKIEEELDKAENIWKQVEPKIVNESRTRKFNKGGEVSSNIPGYKTVIYGEPEVDNFVAFVLDVRGSTNRLLNSISPKNAKVSQLERVLYETTAINTAGILIIEEFGGGVTELLGDGLLALFNVQDDNNGIYSAHNAAKKCILVTNKIVNKVLDERYSLPPLVVGIGLAYSQAIIHILGVKNNYHPKAIGECVYKATKLASGRNEILIDKALKYKWPTVENGTMIFNLIGKTAKIDFEAYSINYK